MTAGWGVLATAAATFVSAPAAASDVPAFHLEDPEIIESSSLTVSRDDPRLAFTINDSGDSARVFTVDTRSGETVGVTTLAGVDHVDFEALAVAPGGRLIVGDIGDNDAERASVQVHLIDEPGRGETVAQPRTLELTYADGPRDAEAVLVRDGRLLVVSKQVFGGEVYQGPAVRNLPSRATLQPVAPAPGTVTDATVLGDGRVVLRNYTAAFVMTDGWQIARTLTLPPTELGESAAAPPDGRWFYAGSEGERSPVYRIAVPAAEPHESSTAVPGEPSGTGVGEPVEHDSVGGEGGFATSLAPWAGGALLVVGLVLVLARRRGR